MRKYKLEIIGFFVLVILGVIFHFLFDWLNQSRLIAIFVPVNESIFEHLKVLFFPYLIWGLIRYFIDGKGEPNFISAHIFGVLGGMFFIITSFYTYTGIIGNHFFIIDMIIYVLSIILTLILTKNMIDSPEFSDNIKVLSFVTIILILLSFIIFTYNPPLINLFKDQSTGNYGI
ncbi:TPA: hypothetical protein GXZ54_02645 [bacterium]|jgi:hypothetical protein|nr:hypothetical protein [bacterium]